jgi:hypothetical protein
MSLTLTEDEREALEVRIIRLMGAADRALENNNDAKAERLTDKADALAMALAALDDESADARDLACIEDGLRREREYGNL